MKNKQSILMSDIYSFFPEIDQNQMPEDLVVPFSVMEDGIMVFIEELKDRLSESSPIHSLIA